MLHFDGALTLTDDTGNLELQGADLAVAAEDEVILKSDGTNWHLVAWSGGLRLGRSYTVTGTWDFTGATVTGTTTFASGAEVNTGTEAAKAIAPNTVVSHEGVIKGWINLDGTGTMTVDDHFNVTTGSCVDNGTGDYTIAWATDFAGTDYACVATAGPYSGPAYDVKVCIAAIAAGTVQIKVLDNSNNPQDVDPLCVIAIGDR